MPKFNKLALILAGALGAATLVPGPAAAQFSDSYRFLDAVKKKDGTKATDLLNNGGSSLINTRDLSSGETALHIATARRDLTWMQFLAAKGANVNQRDFKGQTALVVACNFNFLEGADFLIQLGAKVDEPNNTGETPLITAVHNRNIALIRALLKGGADPDRADNSGRTARDYARLDPKSEVLLSEIDSNAKPKPKPGQGPQIFGPN